MAFAGYTLKNFNKDSTAFKSGSDSASIGVVEVNGAIRESKQIIELLHRAEKDESIKAIIVRINSPGGVVGPTEEIYEEMIRIDNRAIKKEKNGKPVYASFGSMAASGGYYIGAAARKIYSNAGTITGSIGVIMNFVNYSGLMEWAKIKDQTVKAGRYKDIGNSSREMTQEEKDLLGNTLSIVRKQFVNAIRKTRGKKIKGDLEEIAQGQIFSGEEALKLGLVDEIGGLWHAGRKIHEELKLEGEFGLRFIKKKKKSKFWKLLDNLDEASTFIKEQVKSSSQSGLYFEMK